MTFFTHTLIVYRYLPAALFVLFCNISKAQYCMGGPSSPADSQVESVQITGIASSINHSGCPGSTGVENFTAQIVSLGAGNMYHLYVDFGTCGGNYQGAGEAWIDYNQNFVFEPSESLGTWMGTPPAAIVDFGFTVPFGATSGITRMRIQQQESASPPLNPCASFTWGSVMDFGVNIQNGINCTGYTGDDMADAIAVTALPYIDTNNTSICYANDFLVYNSPDVYYKFVTSPGAYDVHLTTCNSSFDTYLTLLDKNGNVVSYNDDGFVCGSNSDILYFPQAADTFYAVVEGWNLSSGQYILKIEENSGLGINAFSENQFGLFPNPATSEITLSGIPRETRIEITDMNGKSWKSFTWYNQTNVSVAELPAGMYLLSADIPQKGILYKKLMIQHP